MSLNTILATTPLTSTNYVLKATGTTIGNSLIFDNGTNVGIGNTNTSYTLDVSGSTRTSAVQPSLLINYTDATSYANLIFTESGVNKGIIQFIGSTFATTSRRNNLEIVNGANADMTFWTNNTTRMTITSAGNVGIGLTNPSFPLEVSSTTTTLLARFTSNQANAAIRIVNNSSNGGRTYSIGSGDTTSGAGNNFYIYDESNSALRFAINNSGNIGIGTSSPGAKLDVTGAVRASTYCEAYDGTRDVYLNSAADFGLGVLPAIQVASNHGLQFATNNSLKMYITSAGNVGIGNVGDSAVRLGVTGTGTSSAAYAFIAYDITANALLALRNDGYTFMGTRANSPYNYNTTYAPRTAGLDAAGGIGYITSTRESKGNIKTIKNIDFINQLNPVSFNYRKKNENKTEFIDELYEDVYYGFIADEVEALDKNLVFYDDVEGGGKKLSGVHYNSMIAILTKAIQELNERLNKAGL